MTQPAPTMRQFFATAHALNLQVHKGDYTSHAIKAKESLELFEAIEQLQRFSGAFDPWAIVDETGLPFIQALLRADNILPVAWIDGWAQRNGLETVFQGATSDDEQPLVYWMEQRLLPSLERHSSKHSIDMGRWLAQRSPWWDPVRAALWVEKLKAVPSGVAPQVSSLLDLIVNRGIQVTDPSRCPERWWSAEQVRAFLAKANTGEAAIDLLDRQVLCPSGRMRPLGELLALRLGLEELASYHPVRDAGLPSLPHKRRDALAREWVLDSEIDLQQARRRLWACMKEKDEVSSVLLATHDAAPDAAQAKRIANIMASRDEQGRSFSAFLSLSKLSWAIPALVDRGWAQPDDMGRQGDGAGLVEQCLANLLGASGTTFHLPSDSLLDEDALGPSSRYAHWVDMLVDHIAFPSNRWGGIGQVGRIADALPACPEKTRLQEAIWFNTLGQSLFVGAGERYPNGKQSNSYNASFIGRYLPGIKAFTEYCLSNDLLLEVGREEWRQWGVMQGRQDWLENKPSWLGASLHSEAKNLCAILETRTLEHDLARVPLAPSPSSRRGRRL